MRFFDPATVPGDDGEFAKWYRNHVKQFFNVSGEDYDELFSIHMLEHKNCRDTGAKSFDGLCCDGSANYVKLRHNNGGWEVIDFKARGYRKEAKKALGDWIVPTYSRDHYDGPPPITESGSLLKYFEAGQVARKALSELDTTRSDLGTDATPIKVVYPLGFEKRQIQAYKVIKPSAFLFRTPNQRTKFLKAIKKFEEKTGCGLELLVLRTRNQWPTTQIDRGPPRTPLQFDSRGYGELYQGIEPHKIIRGTRRDRA